MKRFLDTFSKTSVANIIAIIIVIGVFILMYIMTLKPIPAENKDIIQIAVGFVFGGALGGVTAWLYSASKKDDKQEA